MNKSELENRIKELELELSHTKSELISCKQAKQDLKEREESFISMYENSPVAISIIEQDTTMSMVNNEYCKLSGYSKEEAIGMSWTRQVTSADLDIFKEFYLRTKNDNPYDIPYKHEFAFYKKNGELRYAILLVVNLSNNKKMASFVDVTEQKKVEQALQESERKLRESNQTKDKFFCIIAHDLRSPFNSILGLSDILYNDFDKYNSEDKKKFIGLMYKSINRVYKLLDNLLIWSLSQRGKIVFNPEEINLYLLSLETIEFLNQAAEDKSIKILYQTHEDICINADKQMLSIIIRNLISNAIKFTPKEGEINIIARLISDKNNNETVEITISDNGIGIPCKVLTKLFDIGCDISTKGTDNETGTGLGLVLCKEFVEKHGGKIWVKSEVGKGSDFKFTLPLNKS